MKTDFTNIIESINNAGISYEVDTRFDTILITISSKHSSLRFSFNRSDEKLIDISEMLNLEIKQLISFK